MRSNVAVGDKVRTKVAVNVGSRGTLNRRKMGLVSEVHDGGTFSVVFEGKGVLELTTQEFTSVKRFVKVAKLRLGDKAHFPNYDKWAKITELHLDGQVIRVVGDKGAMMYDMEVVKGDLVAVQR